MQFKVLLTMESKNKTHSEDLQHIRSMMERSSRFISLNGLAGVIAGISALIAGGIAQHWISQCIEEGVNCDSLNTRLFALAFITLVVSIGCGIYLTVQRTKKNSLPIWTNTTRKLLLHFSIPLLVGAFVCLAFYYHESYVYIVPTTLIFYGLALISASPYTIGDALYLGICEVILGMIGMFLFSYGMALWMLGFGVLHIVYGIIVYRKYS